jgi:glycine dehydrogenase subunit 1
VLVPKTLNTELLKVLKVYAGPWQELVQVDYHPKTGLMDLDDLRQKIGPQTAAVFIENPSYLGFIEEQCFEIAEIAHRHGALLIAKVNPSSLGLIAPPGDYGADIACGEGQPLGLHMTCGGACLGILAHADDERFYSVMPSFLVSMAPTTKAGEFTYSWHTLYDRMVYVAREEARSFTGTSSWLWAIATAVYMALMGPAGMQNLGKTNMQKAYYAMDLLSQIKGVKVPYFGSAHFNEFVVNFDHTGKRVEEINRLLYQKGIFGGKDLSQEFPQFGNSALYCVTEVHSKEEIERLAQALQEATV